MFRSSLVLTAVLLIFGGCGASIDSIEAFAPIPLEKSPFMPTKDEIKSGKTKVVLTPIDDTNFDLAQRANLGQSLYVELERELSASGTVEVLDREIAAKFENEIRLSEMDADSQMSDMELSAAKYAISGSLSNARFSSRFTQTQRWQDKEGKVHVIPAHYTYTASVSGILKIYAIPSMKILKTIEFSDNTSRREDSRFYGNNHYPPDVSGMLNKAGRDAIHATRIVFKNYLAPKGYIMEQRSDGYTEIVKVSIGSADGLESGSEVEIYTVQSTTNPFTDEVETQSVKIANGLVSNKLTPHRAWIVLEDKTQEIKIGDYIKASYSKEFSDYFNDITKGYNTLVR